MRPLSIKLYVRLSLATILVLAGLNLQSQNPEKGLQTGWSVNVNGGANLFYGDTDNYRFYRCFSNNSEWRFGYGLMIQTKLVSAVTLRGQLLIGDLSGTKRKDTVWFESKIIETSLSAKIDLSSLIWGPKSRLISIYAMGGIGFSHWETHQMCHATNVELNSNGENRTGSGLFGRTLEPVIPFGAGIDFRLSEYWDISVEGTLRPVRSDKLDANEGGFRFDFYSYNFIGITYKIGSRKDKKPTMPPQNLIVQEEIPQQNIENIPIVKEEDTKPILSIEEKIQQEDAKKGLYDSPWPGVIFKVQIAASRKPMDMEQLSSEYNLNGNITETFEDGWYRYSLGSHIKYWKACEYKKLLVTRNRIYDAFVVAFKDDERISIAELVGSNYEDRDLIVENRRPVIPVAYSVQVMASINGYASSQAVRELYEIQDEVFKEFYDGWYHYSVGNFELYSDAAKLRNSMKLRGLTEAFVVGFKNGKRVDLK
ncbi:MAG: hypothetical protein JW731_02440 [Bacteroidales bacterium]|nr:hypothetical protein [Bacteroidales bacterium]